MRALIKNGYIIPESRWMSWYGPNGEALTVPYMAYQMIEIEDEPIPLTGRSDKTAGSEPAPDEKQQRIAALEEELAALRQTP